MECLPYRATCQTTPPHIIGSNLRTRSASGPGSGSFISPQRENKHLIACELPGILTPHKQRLQTMDCKQFFITGLEKY